MPDDLRILESLARRMSARFVITVDPEHHLYRVTWKHPGRHEEVVQDRDRVFGIGPVLQELLHRLDLIDLPTPENVIHWLSPRQRERVRELIVEIHEICNEAARTIGEIEPYLASPRSSLHPSRFGPNHSIDITDRPREASHE